jgi:tetratricopeptide (TPR) repeat protein
MTDELEDQMIAKTESYLAEQKNDKALESANELARIDPKDAIVWYVKGKTHYMMGEYNKALASLSKAAQIESTHPQVWLLTGYTLIAQKRYQESVESLEYVLAVDGQNVEAACALVAVYSILNNPANCKLNLQKALSINKSMTQKILQYYYDNFIVSSSEVDSNLKEQIKSKLQALSI